MKGLGGFRAHQSIRRCSASAGAEPKINTMKTNLYLTTFGKLQAAAVRLAHRLPLRRAAEPVPISVPTQKVKPMTLIHTPTYFRSFLRALVAVAAATMKNSKTRSRMPASWRRTIGVALALGGLLSPLLAVAEGTWIPLQQLAPTGIGTMLLLSDGTVMAEGASPAGTNTWYKLTPGSTGGYTNGTWTTRATMNYTRLYFSSTVLQDGRVFIAGAECGNGTTNAEIYNPFYTPNPDTWAKIPVPSGLITVNNIVTKNENSAGFVDSGSVLLSNGKVLVTPVYPATNGGSVLFDPVANALSLGPTILHGKSEDEASLVKLPDDSILTVDFQTSNSERYIPALNQWINDTNVPDYLYDAYGSEMGAGFLLPDGNAFFIGASPLTAIYTPSGNTNAGSWTDGPSIPGNLGAPDAPAAMMVNGKILCALSPTPYTLGGTNYIFTTPTYFFEYEYSAGANGAFTEIHAPGGGFTLPFATYTQRMLDLPDGTVLFNGVGSQLYVYKPDASPLAAGKPVIQGITRNPDGSLHLSGTLFNGISAGAAYGDDAQMDSNFPLVRFSDAGGTNIYGITYNWSSSSVMTGNKVVTTEAAVPTSVSNNPNRYTMQVVANGIASDPVDFNPSDYDFPTVNFVYPTNGMVLTDSSAPQIAGYADDTNATLKFVRVALARNSDGAWYDFVSSGWGTTTFDFNRNVLNASYVSGNHTGWLAQMPLLPNGNYTVQAQSVNLFNASPWKSAAFTLAVAPPLVAVTSPANNGAVNLLTTISGTASDAVSGLQGNQIHFTLNNNGNFWSGSYWTNTSSTDPSILLTATVISGAWTFTNVPTGNAQAQGIYYISAFAQDNAGNLSQAQSGVTSTSFTINTTPPNVAITFPANGSTITNQLGGNWFQGTASGNLGIQVGVSLFIRRNSDNLYWTGSGWGDVTNGYISNTYTSGNQTWQSTGALPVPGSSLGNGYYHFIAIAVDAAGNRQQVDSVVSVDFHPVYVFTAGSYYDTNAFNDNMNWSNPANWDVGSVPTSDARVVINNFTPDNTSLGSNLKLYRLDLSAGTLTTAGMVITNLNVSGGALSGGVISIPANGVFNWSGGTLVGSFNVPATAMLNLSGADKALASGSTISSAGNTTWTGAGRITVQGGSVFNNTGSFVAQNDALFFYDSSAGAQPVFNNGGSFTKTNSTGTTDFNATYGGMAFNNNGSVNVRSGNLTLGGGGTFAGGPLTIAAGSLIDFYGGAFSFNGNRTLTGPGTNLVNGASVTFNNVTNTLAGALTFEFDAGVVAGTNTFSGAGTVNWNGGTLVGSCTLPATVPLNIGGVDKSLRSE